MDFTGDGELFMLRVRGDSMIDLGILDGDFVIAVQQDHANQGDIIVAGIPGGEATVKTYQQRGTNIVLVPANPTMQPMEFPADDVAVFGRVVTVMRRL
jgi:repressor LexA